MRLATVILLLLAGILAGTQLGKVAPLVGWFQSGIGFSLVLTGWFTAAIGLFVALAALPAGWAIERVGTRRSFATAALLLTVGGAGLAGAASPWTMLGFRLVEGLGYLVLVIVVPALLNAVPTPAWRAPALAVWGGFVPIGFAVGDFLARAVDAPVQPRLFLALAAAGFALFALPAAILLSRVRNAEGTAQTYAEAGPGVAATITAPVVLVSLAFGFYVIGSVGFFAFLPTFVERPNSSVVLSAGLISLATPVGNAVAGLLVKGRGAGGALGIALAGFVLTALAALPAFGQSAAATPAILLFAVAGGLTASALFAALPAVVPAGGSPALAIGLLCQAGGLGTLAGPPLAAAAIETYGWSGFSVFAAFAALAGLLATLALLRVRVRSPPGSATRL